MAKKKKKKNGIKPEVVIIGGLLLYMLSRRNNNASTNNNQQQPPVYTYPQPPAQNSPQWAQWAQTIISTFGNVAQLWAPGGPFYNQPTQDIIDATGVTPPDIYSPDYGLGPGWA